MAQITKTIFVAVALLISFTGYTQSVTDNGGKLSRHIKELDDAVHNMYRNISGKFRAEKLAGTPPISDSIKFRFLALSHRNQAKVIKLIKENPDSPVIALTTLNYLKALQSISANTNTVIMPGTPDIVVETILKHSKERYASCSERVKESDAGKELAEYISTVESAYTASRNIREGNVAPDFTLQDPEGNPFSLYEIKCKVKIINFWASWCKPCRHENPDLFALYNEFQAKGLEIISISLDTDKAKWLEAIEEDRLLWTYHGSEPKSGTTTIANAYNVSMIPATYLLDANNKIIAINAQGEVLKQKIMEILNE